jgi:hypothetical protein
MATLDGQFDDTSAVRKRFLEAVAGARPPIRARDLNVPGLDRRATQKRLERLRRQAGGPRVSDVVMVRYARDELDRLADPVTRGLAKLARLGLTEARRFAEAAGLQGPAIGDWIELARSPGDRGWTRSQITVRQLAVGSIFARGKAQSWLREKKVYLRELWSRARQDPGLRRHLTPNLLKLDLVGFRALGTEDSPDSAVDVAPVDWLTCLSLNSRADEPVLVAPAKGETVRDRWGKPRSILERRGLPGMIVAHIVLHTVENRLLVCLRQSLGLQDEPGTWSLAIEERWAGRGAQSVGGASDHGDRDPHDVVGRGLHEELGLSVKDEDVRVLAWGLEASILYPGFIAIARTELGSWQVEMLRGHADDPNEVRFVASVPADLRALDLLETDEFAPEGRPDLRRPWHRTSKARLVTALAHLQSLEGNDGRQAVLAYLGRR